MLKKLTCIAAAVILVVSLFPLGAQAAAEPRFTAENQTVITDRTLVVDVALADNPGIISLRVHVDYDPMYLQLERVEDLGVLTGMTESVPEFSSPYTLRWADALAPGNNMFNGNFVRLHFRAINPIEKTDVAVRLVEARNYTGELISFAEARANITVHNLKEVAATPEDHANPGNIQHWHCDHCGRFFADENATTELSPGEIVIPPVNHNFDSQWLFDESYHWHACDCGMVSDYGEHSFDGDTDASCNDCDYIRSLPYLVGDINNDGSVTDSDAVYLLRNTLFEDDYPISQPADFNRDGNVTDSDAVYLLRHTLFEEDYPLNPL